MKKYITALILLSSCFSFAFATSGLRMSLPKGGESWVQGQTYKVEWISIPRVDYQTDNVVLRLSSNTGKILDIDVSNKSCSTDCTTEINTYYFQVPSDFPTGVTKFYIIDKNDANRVYNTGDVVDPIIATTEKGYIRIIANQPSSAIVNQVTQTIDNLQNTVVSSVSNTTQAVTDNVQDTIDCANITHNLKLGSRDSNTGGDVTTLQIYLSQANFLDSDPTGYFGGATKRAVQAFQSANGISSTGNVGPLTRAKIQGVSCGGSNAASVNTSTSNDKVVNVTTSVTPAVPILLSTTNITANTILSSPTSCVIQNGSNSCLVTLKWNIVNTAINPQIFAYNKDYNLGLIKSGYYAGNHNYNTPKGDTVFSIKDGDSLLDSITVTATCLPGSIFDTTETCNPAGYTPVIFTKTIGSIDQNVSPNTANVKIGSFTINSISNQSVTVGMVQVDLSVSGYQISNLKNLILKSSGKVFGRLNPVIGRQTFTYFPYDDVTIAPNQSKTFDIYIDIGDATMGTIHSDVNIQYTSNGVTKTLGATGINVNTVATSSVNSI